MLHIDISIGTIASRNVLCPFTLWVERSEFAKILVFWFLLDNDLGGEVLLDTTINDFRLLNCDRVSLVEQPLGEQIGKIHRFSISDAVDRPNIETFSSRVFNCVGVCNRHTAVTWRQRNVFAKLSFVGNTSNGGLRT